MSEIDAYRRFVERLAELDSTEVFSNGQPAHAQVIFETFFKFAKKNVVIFCHQLSEKVYGQQCLVDAVENALNRGISVRILTQRTPQATNFISALAKWRSEQKPIKLNTAREGGFESELQSNFAVMDAKAYRFEPANKAHTAFACMNDANTAQKLSNVFDQLDARAA